MPLNRERAVQLMQDRGVDALVASSTENVYYVSDYWSLSKNLGCGVEAYVVLPLNNDPAIIAPMNEADLIIHSGTWIDDLRFYGEPNVDVGEVEEPSEQTASLLKIHKETKTETDGTSALLKALEDLGVNKGAIALDTSDLSPTIFEHIKGKIPDSKIIDGSSLLREIRQVKTQPGVIGRPLGKAQRLWEAVQGAQDSVLDIIKPGVKLSELYAEAEKELAKAEVKMRTPSIGHGLGVECNERPWIERGGEAELLEGMVVNVDIPILELGWGGLQIEDTILVTGDGCELLTKTDRGLYLL